MEEPRNNIGTIAFPFAENSSGAKLVNLLQEVCRKRNVLGEFPKLGPHATIMPPFRATETELRLAAILMRMMWKWKPIATWVEAREVKVFAPPEGGGGVTALYVEVLMPDEYHEFVEKHKLNWPLPFVHAPAWRNPSDRIWVPHISVIEGDTLHLKASKLLPILNQYAEGRRIEFGEPHLFCRRPSGPHPLQWEKALV